MPRRDLAGRAAYMRDYRAARHPREDAPEQADPTLARLRARILDLEEEVRHLKAELAKRPDQPRLSDPPFNSRPFSPAPKR